jgi:hypothetical protein
MARKTFFSFHYKPDNWRASQVRNMGVIEGNAPVSDNDWETITKGGDDAIKKWIAGQLDGKSCSIVLIGSGTAGRKWINHEILQSWEKDKGLVGIHVHNLKDVEENQSYKGANPFTGLTVSANNQTLWLSTVVKTYDPPYTVSTDVYKYIKDNIAAWVEEAVTIRNKY